MGVGGPAIRSLPGSTRPTTETTHGYDPQARLRCGARLATGPHGASPGIVPGPYRYLCGAREPSDPAAIGALRELDESGGMKRAKELLREILLEVA